MSDCRYGVSPVNYPDPVICSYNGTVRILVISNLCTYWVSLEALYALSTFETVSLLLLYNDYNIPTINNVQKISYQKGKIFFFANYVGI